MAPGAFDAISARLVAAHSFEAVYCGGYAAAASAYGLPDLGLLGMAEMLGIYGRIARASGIPIVVDADTGYGGPLNIARTVGELRHMGVAGLQIEDQVNPKQCGHLDRKEVVGITEGVARVRVAVDAAADDGPAVIARVDALQQEGLASAIERGKRYRDAGADAVFVDAPRNRSDVEAIRQAVPGPLVYNAVRTGKGANLTLAELAELGYAMVILPVDLLYVAHGAMSSLLHGLSQDGELDAKDPPRPTFEEFNKFLGVPELLDLERGYADPIELTAPPGSGQPVLFVGESS